MVGYLDNFAPHHFHSAREHCGQVDCTYKKGGEERNKRLQFPEFRSSLHAYFKCLRVNKVNL